ncbi:hypothetical protein TSAR_009124 [Trichomalopsis sarcophagae]|uniref:Uncharacterized protein n=1 Tax=Trichomalopsis sarcophagae TaxID=543379 RepID=A0A232EKL5_9HYME|nr:hypothetical protein TSAR_009124 [Trichomalopsis sarcophagae]
MNSGIFLARSARSRLLRRMLHEGASPQIACHRICKICVKHLFERECPSCRQPITTYLPEHMIGDEA